MPVSSFRCRRKEGVKVTLGRKAEVNFKWQSFLKKNNLGNVTENDYK